MKIFFDLKNLSLHFNLLIWIFQEEGVDERGKNYIPMTFEIFN